MEDFKINQTEDTPELSFLSATHTYSIIGKSYPENPTNFYLPEYRKLESFLSTADQLTIVANLEYINSSSVKMVFAFLNLLNTRHVNNPSGKYKVIWKYKASDKIMENKGKEFQEFLDLPFELIAE